MASAPAPRVLVDATAAAIGATGVSRYAVNLLEELRREGVSVWAFALGRGAAVAGARRVRVPLRVMHASWRWLGHPRAEWIGGGSATVFHSLDMIPAPTRLPLVMTVHDLDAVAHPQIHPARAVRIQEQQIRSLMKADAVCANSQVTAESLRELGVDRVVVTKLGLTVLPVAPDAVVRGSYVLAVGAGHARKGHDLLVRAFAASGLTDHVLVFAGGDGEGSRAARDDATALGVEDRCRWLGHVSDADLGRLYRDAELVCLPSVSEGFGLPVIEALAAGTPVVCTDAHALREVGGDLARYVPVGQLEALSQALANAVQDPELARRIHHDGPIWASQFEWRETAARTLDAYALALAHHEAGSRG